MIIQSIAILVIIILPLAFYLWTFLLTRSKVLSIERLPKSECALVFGAGLKKNGMPTEILMDRVLTSIQAVKSKKISTIIFSGSINHKGYSEPMAMQNIAESQGVNHNQVIIDEYGNSTYDSCINYLLSDNAHPVILITQPFHLPRSLLICQMIGLPAYGLPANNINHSLLDQIYWLIRELYALPYNLFKIAVFFLDK